MGERVEETYESVKAYGQAIKGDERFAERLQLAAGTAPAVGRLTEAKIAAAVAADL